MNSPEILKELAVFAGLPADWDGAGAAAPRWSCLIQCRRFVSLLPEGAEEPEPMIHGHGTAGLYWNRPGLYADIEFGTNGMGYYCEIDGQELKGMDQFDGHVIPPSLAPLIAAITRTL